MPKSPTPPTTGQGAQSITFNSADFSLGMSSGDNAPDGGFSSASTGINLTSSIGTVSATAPATTPTFSTGSLHNQFIATCANESIASAFHVALDNGGWFYTRSTNGNYNAKVQDTTNSYQQPYSDLVNYLGKYYASTHNVSNDNVAQYDGATTVVVDWFHTNSPGSVYLTPNVPHPMLVYNGFLYIADGYKIHKWDGSTITLGQLTYTSDVIITALVFEPQSGLMLVAYNTTTTGLLLNDNTPSISKIGMYDGLQPTQFRKVVIVEDVIFGMLALGGDVFIAYGDSLGVWNGSGVSFLRALGIGNSLNKQRMTNIGNNFCYCDGDYITVYSEVLQKSDKVFWYVLKTAFSITSLFNAGLNQLGFSQVDGSSNPVLSVFDVTAAGTSNSSADLRSKFYRFPRPVYIRAFDIQLSQALGVSETVLVEMIDDTQNVNNTVPVQINNTFASPVNRLQMNTLSTTSAQFRIIINGAASLVNLICYYDFKE